MARGRKPTPVSDRFWTKVENGEGCWVWKGYLAPDGYGKIRRDGGKTGLPRYILAHRLSWEIHNGKPPRELMVCHRCDNPRCVNPDHLFLGTALDNTRDMVSKGRHRGASKLSREDKELIRLAADTLPVTQRQLAEAWGVSHTTIWRAIEAG